jgi:hypothetical protein
VPAHGAHIATLAHEGRFWDVYVELEEPRARDVFARGRLRFLAADASPEEPEAAVCTAYIFVEDSGEAVLTRARALHMDQVVGLLRSCLP